MFGSKVVWLKKDMTTTGKEINTNKKHQAMKFVRNGANKRCEKKKKNFFMLENGKGKVLGIC